jgi:hypothetical protein
MVNQERPVGHHSSFKLLIADICTLLSLAEAGKRVFED